MFETTVQRTVIPLRYRGSQLELAVDTGEIKTGRRRAQIHEVEIELKNGKPDSVIALGREIAKKLKAGYGVASKAERGYALREGEAVSPVCAQDIFLSRAMSASEAFQTIAMSCLHHFAANHEAVIAGAPEGVHQMRVGLRRLRAALSVFKELLRGPETEAIKTDLKWLTEELGPARDMDVLAKEGVSAMAKSTLVPMAAKALKTEIAVRREEGFGRAKRAVASDRYRKVVLETALSINGGKWTKIKVALIAERRAQAASKFAAQELDRRYRKILKTLDKLEKLSPLKRHKLRIAVKKLCYATGYFESLFQDEKKWIKKLSAVLKDLQSSLGHLNDIRVHGRLAQEFAAPAHVSKRGAREAFAMGELSGEEHAKSQDLLQATKRRGKRLDRCPVFWA